MLKRQRPHRPAEVTRAFGAVRLHLDDVAEVLQLVRDFAEKVNGDELARAEETAKSMEERGDGSGDTTGQDYLDAMREMYEVKLIVGDAEADEVDDLKDASAKQLKDVIVRCFMPRVWVHLGKGMAQITVGGNSDAEVALAEDVAHAVRQRSTVVPLEIAAVLLYVALAAVGAGWAVSHRLGGPSLVATMIFGSLFGYSLATVGWAVKNGRAHVIPVWRREERRLSQRSRRDLLVAAIGALMGGAAAGVVTAYAVAAAGS